MMAEADDQTEVDALVAQLNAILAGHGIWVVLNALAAVTASAINQAAAPAKCAEGFGDYLVSTVLKSYFDRRLN
jgi:hypothetical protein